MSKDKFLDWATPALNQKDYLQASKYYEEHADTMLFHDKSQAAFYYSPAAQYEKTSISRALVLYHKASKLYEQYGETSSSADMLMAIGLLYQEKGEEANAVNEFKKCIAIYLNELKSTIQQVTAKLKQADSEHLLEQLDKVKFCLKQITLEEKP